MENIDSDGHFEASVNLFVDQTQKTQIIEALSKIENIEAIYEVKGEFDIVSIVSASSLEEFRNVLQKKILKIKGIKSTITSIFLKAHKSSMTKIRMRYSMNITALQNPAKKSPP